MKMHWGKVPARCALTICIAASFSIGVATAHAQDAQLLEPVEVTTTKIPIPLSDVAATVTIVTGDELRARNATDLRTALALVAGVDIAPGGDGGPTSSVPSLWGLREFDAFLLLVDGVPWGGAFTPALATLDVSNVERIEVLKGAAPVSYGATSFVGVINVIHYAAGQGPARVDVGVGSHGSARISAAIPLSEANAPWRQSLLIDADTVELSVDRAGWDRAHLLYRGAGEVGPGTFSVDADGMFNNQDPTSPIPREGPRLSPLVPDDANVNPRGAKQNEDRGQLSIGYVVPTDIGEWNSRFAYARSVGDNVRGFLRQDFPIDGSQQRGRVPAGPRSHRDLFRQPLRDAVQRPHDAGLGRRLPLRKRQSGQPELRIRRYRRTASTRPTGTRCTSTRRRAWTTSAASPGSTPISSSRSPTRGGSSSAGASTTRRRRPTAWKPT